MGASKLPPDLQEKPLSQPGFNSLLSLADQSRVLVKVSGLYRVSGLSTSHFSDTKPAIQAFAHHIPNQLIWGSDWPHTGDGSNRVDRHLNVKEPFRLIDSHAILQSIRDWVGDEVWRMMLKDNPARVFQ